MTRFARLSPRQRRSGLAWALAATATVAALVFPQLFGDQTSLATKCLIYGLVVVTLNLLVGYGGQVSLGHAGLFAVGAYVVAVLGTHFQTMTNAGVPRAGLPVPIELLAAGAATAVVGFLLGLPTGRLRGHYLAIATLGFGLAVPQLALNLSAITNGSEGLTVPVPTIVVFDFDSPLSLYYLTLVVVALSLIAVLSLLGTRTGRSVMAMRDSEAAALAMGIDVRRTKIVLFVTSAFLCGVAGGLFAHFNGLVAPSDYSFSLSLFFFAAVIIGGLASIWGSMAGAVLLVVVQNYGAGSSGLTPALVGAAVVIVLLLLPGGLAALPRRLRQLWSRRRPHPVEAIAATAPGGE